MLNTLLLELDAESRASDCVAELMEIADDDNDSAFTKYSDIVTSHPVELSLVFVVVDDM